MWAAVSKLLVIAKPPGGTDLGEEMDREENAAHAACHPCEASVAHSLAGKGSPFVSVSGIKKAGPFTAKLIPTSIQSVSPN